MMSKKPSAASDQFQQIIQHLETSAPVSAHFRNSTSKGARTDRAKDRQTAAGNPQTQRGLASTFFWVDALKKDAWLESFKKGRNPDFVPSSELLVQLEQELCSNSESKKESNPTKDSSKQAAAPLALRLRLEGGNFVSIVFVDRTVETFELHTLIRKETSHLWKLGHAKLPDDQAADRRLIHFVLRDVSERVCRPIILGLAASLQIHAWREYRVTATQSATPCQELQLDFVTPLLPKVAHQIFEEGTALGHANSQVRLLAELPPNLLHPSSYLRIIQKLGNDAGLANEFLGVKELEKLGAGAFLAVGRSDPSRTQGIAILKYRPSRNRKGTKATKGKNPPAPIVLVGKGLCFDTGGYSLKPTESMLGMHADMTGSALALASILVCARLKVDFEVHAYLALTENLLSPSAYRPNEVVQACDGTTIEVVDTDAEGRMALSDTLALVRRIKPSLVLDFATLTGAAIRSLDTRRGAVFSHHPRLAELAVQVGEECGERTWSFPMSDDYRAALKSECADLIQCGPGRNADHIYAAVFLSHFIGRETPWVHLDLSAAENKGGLGLVPSDTTGFGVFWIQSLIKRWRAMQKI